MHSAEAQAAVRAVDIAEPRVQGNTQGSPPPAVGRTGPADQLSDRLVCRNHTCVLQGCGSPGGRITAPVALASARAKFKPDCS